MSGWRVWLAFEVRPGIMNTTIRDRSQHWRHLANSCRKPDGRIDVAEYDRWLDCLIEHAHLWGEA